MTDTRSTGPATDLAERQARAAEHPRTSKDDRSVGELLGEVTTDLQKLFRQEVELAKVEAKAEAVKAGKAAGMLGGAGFAGYMVTLLGSFTLMYALANVMDLGWAAFIVTLLWAIAASVMYVVGRNRMKMVSPKPERTIETLKEDAEWAKHPTHTTR